MLFTRLFKVFTIFLAVFVGYSAAAKTNYAKVRYKLGDVKYEKNSSNKWDSLRTNQKVYQKDAIQTGIESHTILATPDGSALTIEEKTIVAMAELLSEDGFNETVVEISKGKLHFKAQKIANQKSKFEFRTGTAVAAIRGTEGSIGKTSGKEKPFASLSEGKLEIHCQNGETVTIVGGQTAVMSDACMDVYDLSASGSTDFINSIESFIDDTTLTADSLAQKLHRQDSLFTLKKQALAETYKCEFAPLPDKVKDTVVVAKGSCTAGIDVEIGGEQKKSDGSEMTFHLEWDITAPLSEKKFPITCRNLTEDSLSIPCGVLVTNYAERPIIADSTADTTKVKEPLTITTASPIKVCDPASMTIEGTFDNSDPEASLTVNFGNYTSPNLVPLSAEGVFSHTINISDARDNWNGTKANVIYKSKTLGEHSVALDVIVDKTCKNVNTLKPSITLKATDSLKCFVKLWLDNLKGDEAIYRFAMDDGTEGISTRYNDNALIKQTLKSGSHRYDFSIEDQAGNKQVLSKTLGCYPQRRHTIELSGANNVRMRVPPNAPTSDDGEIVSTFYKKLEFKVTNLPENDPSYIKSITISQNGKADIILRSSDFMSNHFDADIELTRGKVTTVNIKVVMKNGSILNATRTYEAK